MTIYINVEKIIDDIFAIIPEGASLNKAKEAIGKYVLCLCGIPKSQKRNIIALALEIYADAVGG